MRIPTILGAFVAGLKGDRQKTADLYVFNVGSTMLITHAVELVFFLVRIIILLHRERDISLSSSERFANWLATTTFSFKFQENRKFRSEASSFGRAAFLFYLGVFVISAKPIMVAYRMTGHWRIGEGTRLDI